VRELIYLSDAKLRMFMDAVPFPRARSRGGAASIEVLGAKGEISVNPAEPGEEDLAEVQAAKLAAVITHLDREWSPVPFTTPGLRPNQWIHFDVSMGYGTAHEDSGRTPDDVVLFGGSAAPTNTGQSRDVELLLCGSIHHLRDRIASVGRMGSDTRWLYELIKETSKLDQQGVSPFPNDPTDLVPANRSLARPEEVSRWVFDIIDRQHPPNQRGRLRGHARVLFDSDDERWFTRLVVATPLYVEISPPPRPVSFWHRLVSRQSRHRVIST
jgi:hypothetical protein